MTSLQSSLLTNALESLRQAFNCILQAYLFIMELRQFYSRVKLTLLEKKKSVFLVSSAPSRTTQKTIVSYESFLLRSSLTLLQFFEFFLFSISNMHVPFSHTSSAISLFSHLIAAHFPKYIHTHTHIPSKGKRFCKSKLDIQRKLDFLTWQVEINCV